MPESSFTVFPLGRGVSIRDADQTTNLKDKVDLSAGIGTSDSFTLKCLDNRKTAKAGLRDGWTRNV